MNVMKEHVSTISKEGQVTIPAEVRQELGVAAADKIAFVITDDGTVELRAARHNLESVLGALPALSHETTALDTEIAEAQAAALHHKHRP